MTNRRRRRLIQEVEQAKGPQVTLAGETRAGTPAEHAIRVRLMDRKIMKTIKDDLNLYKWIKSMSKPQEDARTEFEKGIQKRIGRELGLS